MSDQTNEITLKNVAFHFVVYCIENKISVNESKINTYFDRKAMPIAFETKIDPYLIKNVQTRSKYLPN